ncbi:hypothetical protein RCN91_05535, partial [Escherichia marmotae]|nr:hypothetical protein [Escherichia marmotae]MED9790763.1 hypothetical protein [Escherichia marmotae]
MPISNPASLSHLALILITGVSLWLVRYCAGSTTGRAGRLKRRETYSGMRGVVPETFTDRQYSYNGQDELLKTRHSRRGEKDYFYDPTGHITA